MKLSFNDDTTSSAHRPTTPLPPTVQQQNDPTKQQGENADETKPGLSLLSVVAGPCGAVVYCNPLADDLAAKQTF